MNQGEFSRLYQCAKLYMYSPSSGLYSCPLAMTDGAAKTIHSLKLPLGTVLNFVWYFVNVFDKMDF